MKKIVWIELRQMILTAVVCARLWGLGVAGDPAISGIAGQPGFHEQEFVFEQAPFAQCHASTIAQTPSGLVAAWFGGTREKHADVGIWFARRTSEAWSEVVEVANGVQNEKLRHPCWNPVLHQAPGGPLVLFYKVGPSPSSWWGMSIASTDAGHTWSTPRRLPEGILGPIKNKPFQLSDGGLLCPSSTEHVGWRVHMEWTPDWGQTWHATSPLNDGQHIAAIQPAVLSFKKKLQILCRSRQGKIVEAWSDDNGRSWNSLTKTELPNPSSGIDAVTLKDGRALLVYNHTARGRSPLNVAVSRDGKDWKAALVLENQPGEYSYPAVIQASSGLVHITYTWKRKRVKHIVVDPAKFVLRDMPGGRWPE